MGVEEGGEMEKRGWMTFEECCQEVMTQFSTMAIKRKTKSWEKRRTERWRMERG